VNRQKEFYPDYLIEILLVIFLIVELIATLALLYPPPIGRQIDFPHHLVLNPSGIFSGCINSFVTFPANEL
jgi:hypothetical protein